MAGEDMLRRSQANLDDGCHACLVGGGAQRACAHRLRVANTSWLPSLSHLSFASCVYVSRSQSNLSHSVFSMAGDLRAVRAASRNRVAPRSPTARCRRRPTTTAGCRSCSLASAFRSVFYAQSLHESHIDPCSCSNEEKVDPRGPIGTRSASIDVGGHAARPYLTLACLTFLPRARVPLLFLSLNPPPRMAGETTPLLAESRVVPAQAPEDAPVPVPARKGFMNPHQRCAIQVLPCLILPAEQRRCTATACSSRPSSSASPSRLRRRHSYTPCAS
jgi:hypothetical protein